MGMIRRPITHVMISRSLERSQYIMVAAVSYKFRLTRRFFKAMKTSLTMPSELPLSASPKNAQHRRYNIVATISF